MSVLERTQCQGTIVTLRRFTRLDVRIVFVIHYISRAADKVGLATRHMGGNRKWGLTLVEYLRHERHGRAVIIDVPSRRAEFNIRVVVLD